MQQAERRAEKIVAKMIGNRVERMKIVIVLRRQLLSMQTREDKC
jgi:hypothetical protein